MSTSTFAEYLINQELPDGYKIHGPITNSKLRDVMKVLAKEKPKIFPGVMQKLKQLGDEIATYEGLSVGLDDITPLYQQRKDILTDARQKLNKARNKTTVYNTLLDAQAKGSTLARAHPGTMGLMVSTGSRGNAAQLMKTVVSPIAVKDVSGLPYPYLIEHSYAEGLTPAEYWVANNEARQDVLRTQLSTALPGDMGKQISASLMNTRITRPDCGTHNGISMSTEDAQVIDRYLARDVSGFKRNELITDRMVRSLKSKRQKDILVRSPLTCNENPGVCQKCYGLNELGQNQYMGDHIGLKSAQALSEPLTQMVLSSKHGVALAKGEGVLGSMEGVRQLLEIPESFKTEALLAKVDGTVSEIRPAPQGGQYIKISGTDHYVHPRQKITVKKGVRVFAGDMLTDGLVNPKDLIMHKGLGVGRGYLKDKMYDFYKADGIDIDKRHLELLARQNYNWVKIDDPDDEGKYIRGDVVTYNTLKEHLQNRAKKVNVTKDIIGEYLTREALHFTVGTRITPDVYEALKRSRIREVFISTKPIRYTPVVKPLEQTPLLDTDWLARMGHRRLKDTLLQGAAYGYKSPIRGDNPYASMLYNNIDMNLDPDEAVDLGDQNAI